MKNISRFVTLGLISLIVTFTLMGTFTPSAQASIYDEADVGLESFESNEIMDESSELNEINIGDFQNPYTVDDLNSTQPEDTSLDQDQSDEKTLDSYSAPNSNSTEDKKLQ